MEYLTVQEVAKFFKVSDMTVYRLIKAKKIGTYRVGQTTRISDVDINKFIEENTTCQ